MRAIFNPKISDMLEMNCKRILFAHVGKCGGEAAMVFLREALDETFVLFELHVNNANAKMTEIVQKNPDDFIFLIAKRDPIERFISAYNWDKHKLYLGEQIKVTRIIKHFESFTTPESLALGLMSRNEKTKSDAEEFGRFAHMGMGQAFYTPLNILKKIPAERLHIFDVKSLELDLKRIVKDLTGRETATSLKVLKKKTDFKSAYPDADRLFSTDLSEDARRSLREFLKEDYLVYELLSEIQNDQETRNSATS